MMRFDSLVLVVGGIVLLSCVSSTNGLSCSECDLSTCPRLDPCSCAFGVGKDVCGCCDKCYQGIAEDCGGPFNIKGVCGQGLTCNYDTLVDTPNQSGKCIWKITHCATDEDCAVVKCAAPNCKYGYYKKKCQCCPVCYKGKGECCRYGDRCACGLKCVNGRCETGKDGCSYRFLCPAVLCEPLVCPHGQGQAPCQCCPTCLREEGDKCGETDGLCRKGLKCECRENETNGICVSITPECSTPKCSCPGPCNDVGCPVLSLCRYGTSAPKSGCCPKCIEGPGGKCGCDIAECAPGLTCSDGICKLTCTEPTENTGGNICKDFFCFFFPPNCINGVGHGPCSCCADCLRGRGETCLPSEPPCIKGTSCINGICKDDTECSHLFKCGPDPCEKLECDYGIGLAPCQCCPTCLVGEDQECGEGRGLCRSGTTCKYDQEKQKNICICDKKIVPVCPPPKCLCPGPCTDVGCPALLNCRYGTSAPKSGCCPKCIAGPDEKCGCDIAECAPGLTCSDGICILLGCNEPKTCVNVLCFDFPTKCITGVGHAPCSCCAGCLRGRGETCSTSETPCIKGTSCVDGRCKDDTKCSHYFHCGPVECEKLQCDNGIGLASCQRCPTCLRGEDQECGEVLGLCRSGTTCKYDQEKQKNICVCDNKVLEPPSPKPDGTPGSCPKCGTCVSRINCNGVRCREPQNCIYGYGAVPCKCCLQCLSGPNQPCGKMNVPCGKGLICVRTSRSQLIYKCISMRPQCQDCRLVKCPLLNVDSCLYGSDTDPCGCCPLCYKGINEKCGGQYDQYGRCSPAFVCKSNEPGQPGVCVCPESCDCNKEEL